MKIRSIPAVISLLSLAAIISCGDKGTDPPGNRAPSITSAASVQAVIDELFTYTGNATDPDGGIPTVTVDNNPSWTTVNGRVISGTPTQNTPDTTFRVIATDGELADTAIVTVEIVASAPQVSYAADIQPIFTNNCAGAQCHIPGPTAGLRLGSYAQVMLGGDSGPVVIPGNPNASILVRRLEGSITPQMPFGRPPLSQSDIQKIRDWISEGAQNN